MVDSGFDGEADEGLPDGGTRVDVDLNGSAEDVIRKVNNPSSIFGFRVVGSMDNQ